MKRLSYQERLKFNSLLKEGKKPREIAVTFGMHLATVYRELERGTEKGQHPYDPDVAQKKLFS